MGDVNGDGVEDVIVFAPIEGQPTVAVFSQNERLWSTPIGNTSPPARVAVVRFPEGTQVIAGDDRGQLVALNQSRVRKCGARICPAAIPFAVWTMR